MTNNSVNYNTPDFKPFQSGCSKCYPSTDYVGLKGGNKSLISKKNGVNLYKTKNYSRSMTELKKTNSGTSYNTSAGGAKKKSKSKGKKESTKKVTKKKTTTKKMKGGEESWGATGMPLRYYNPDMKKMNYSSDSGKGIKSAYGPVEPYDVGVGMLAPYTASNSKTANPNTMMKTGGKIPKMNPVPVKKINKLSNKGFKLIDSFFKKLEQNYKTSVKETKNIKIGNQRLIQGGKKTTPKKKSTKTKSTKTKSTKKDTKKKTTKKSTGKKMKGGDSMPSPLTPEFGMNPGVGTQMAVNTDTPNDLLKQMKGAPMNNMASISMSMEESMMSGGKKSTKKKSTTKKSTTKKSTTKKSTTKKSTTKKSTTKKKMKGGDGSDWALTANSRGPSNAPDNYFGVSGEKWFRQFNKTGEYIPNSKLSEAATPGLIGKKNTKVMGFDPESSKFENVSGGAKKSTKKKSTKKKTSTKKKSTKKKTTKKTTKK